MNERIRELARQATVCYSNGQERTFDKEKFAELIIQECAIMFTLTHTDEQYPRRIDKTILKHFGMIE